MAIDLRLHFTYHQESQWVNIRTGVELSTQQAADEIGHCFHWFVLIRPHPARAWREASEGEPKKMFLPTRNRHAATLWVPPQDRGAQALPNRMAVYITQQPSAPPPGLPLRPQRTSPNTQANEMKSRSLASPNTLPLPPGRPSWPVLGVRCFLAPGVDGDWPGAGGTL